MADGIGIHQLELDCIVGLRPSERVTPQRIRLDMELRRSLSRAGRSGRIAHTTDYDLVARQAEALLRFRRYRLIEMAAEELSALVLGAHGALEGVQLTIHKPAALAGRARGASVRVLRSPADYPSQPAKRSYGEERVLLETREASISLLQVDAAGSVHQLAEDGAALLWPTRGRFLLEEEPLQPDRATLVEPGRAVALRVVSADGGELLRCLRRPAS